MEQLLSVLYGVSGVAASALYIPQIIKYHHDRKARMSISLLSWGGWIAIAAVTILYAIFVVKNVLFAAVAAMNVIAQVTVLIYGLHARLSGRCAALSQTRIAGTPANSAAIDIQRPVALK